VGERHALGRVTAISAAVPLTKATEHPARDRAAFGSHSIHHGRPGAKALCMALLIGVMPVFGRPQHRQY
jgi:hypothetical protein